MVAAVRRGQSLRVVARRFGVGVATVAALGRTGQRPAAGSHRLVRSFARPAPTPTHRHRLGGSGFEDPERLGPRRLGSHRRRRHPLRSPGAGRPGAALASDHQPHPRSPWRTGRPPPHAPAAAAPRLVSARGRRGPGEVGQLRHRRGTGHPRRPPGRGAQRGVLARRIGRVLADGVAGHGGHDRAIARGALARSRLARLRPVRQRHDLPGHASLRGCPGTDHPLVPELQEWRRCSSRRAKPASRP